MNYFATLFHTIDIVPVAPPIVGEAITQLLGIILWVVMIGAIIGLLIIASIGIKAYKHNQAEQFIEKFMWWGAGCSLAVAAVPIVKIFFPAVA